MGCLVEEVHHGECLGSGGDCGLNGGQVGREESDDVGQGFGVGFQSHGLPGVLAEYEVNEFVQLTFGQGVPDWVAIALSFFKRFRKKSLEKQKKVGAETFSFCLEF